MSPDIYKKSKKVWETASEFGKVMLQLADGESGLTFIAKDDSAAAIVLGEDKYLNKAYLVKTWKMFRDRLDDMIKHAEAGKFDKSEGKSMAYIRDSETGEYESIEPDEPPKKKKCPLCNDTGSVGVGQMCICQL